MDLFNIYDSSNKPLIKGVPAYLIIANKVVLPEDIKLEDCIFTQSVRQFNTLKEVPTTLNYIKQLAEEIATDNGVAAAYNVPEPELNQYVNLAKSNSESKD